MMPSLARLKDEYENLCGQRRRVSVDYDLAKPGTRAQYDALIERERLSDRIAELENQLWGE